MITITRGEDTWYRTSHVADATPTVFVVDRDAVARASLERLVEASGWHAETFASAEEFLARRRTRVPSCLIIHVAMPDLDGLDVQRRVAADRPETPVVFTGYADVAMTVRAMKAGAADVLPRPVADEELSSAMRGAIRNSEAALRHEASGRTLRGRFRVAHAARTTGDGPGDLWSAEQADRR